MTDSELGFEPTPPLISRENEPEDSLADVSLICGDCHGQFIWTAGAQEFFRQKNLQNPPKRCKDCKSAKNARLARIEESQSSGIKQRIEYAVNCDNCAATTTVPFYPSQGRPVYCRACFLNLNSSINPSPNI